MPAWKEAKDLEIGDMFLESPPRIPHKEHPSEPLVNPSDSLLASSLLFATANSYTTSLDFTLIRVCTCLL